MYATGLNGLGLVVTVSSRFDPAKMKARFIYWLDQAANEMGNTARQEIQAGGGEPGEGDKNSFRNAAIAQGMIGAASWSSSIAMPKAPSGVATYGKMAAQLAVGIVMPWVGIAWALSSFLGKKKKPQMPIPWGAIYAAALPYAQQMTQAEEQQRIAAEEERIKQERYTEITKVSAKAAAFQLPEGVTSITKGGVLMMQPKGKPVERRK